MIIFGTAFKRKKILSDNKVERRLKVTLEKNDPTKLLRTKALGKAVSYCHYIFLSRQHRNYYVHFHFVLCVIKKLPTHTCLLQEYLFTSI